MQYRCEATSVAGFVQQVAVSYVANGYYFYVAGCIPQQKDPKQVDAKIIERYDIAISKWARARKKQNGHANLQYIRFERFFLILATHGKHRFFDEESGVIRDARRVPIRFSGYSISFLGGHASVRIESIEYRQLKAYFLEHSLRRNAEWIVGEFKSIPFIPYAPVRSQLLAIIRAVNRERRRAGYDEIPKRTLVARRTICQPFAQRSSAYMQELSQEVRQSVTQQSKCGQAANKKTE